MQLPTLHMWGMHAGLPVLARSATGTWQDEREPWLHRQLPLRDGLDWHAYLSEAGYYGATSVARRF